MTTRNTTALGYDAMQRLTSYGTVDTNLYRASNQRLIRTSGTTRTLYVPGMDVTVSAGVRTITRTLTIDGTPYGTRTHTSGTTATMWNCTNPQHTLTCTTPAGSTTIPPRTRYSPYGTPRTTTTITNTDRGHLNQPHDPTGLTYLNNRYYDPTINAFTTIDPLVAKTGTPYLYANGNPVTLSDPTGLEPAYLRGDLCLYSGICLKGSHGGQREAPPVGCGYSCGLGNLGPDAASSSSEMTHRYTFENVLGVFGSDGPNLVASLFFSNPNQTFPFGIPGDLTLGNVIELDDGLPGKAMVRVSFLSDTGFGFESLDGHPEGTGNFITFEFMLNDWGQTVLYIDSWGPPEGSALDLPVLKQLNMDFVRNIWLEFSTALGSVAGQKLPTFPCCPGR